MAALIHLTFYTGSAAYLCAAVLALAFLRVNGERVLHAGGRVLVGGIVLLSLSFVLRWVAWGHLPMTTMTDSLDLFAIIAGVVIVVIACRNSMCALLSFYAPPLALICLINMLFAHRFLDTEPRVLRSSFLSVHVGLAFLAYALFYVASMTSAAYLCQASHLKHHRVSWLVRHLPSLGELDTILYRLIRFGYPFFVITLTLGLIWAFIDRDLLGPYWWLSPKVLLSYVMAGFYAVTFHMRRLGRLRGPKLAQLVFLGFFLIIAGYMVLSILNLRVSYFWSAGR